MNEDTITHAITDTFAGVETTTAYGYTFFFYKSERKLPFVTLATADDEYDRASNLNRPSVFRLNIGVSKNTYRALFGPQPSRPGADGVVDTGHDFTALDQLLPHPVYAPQSWVCVLNPSVAMFQQTVLPLIAEAYELSATRHAKVRSAEKHPAD